MRNFILMATLLGLVAACSGPGNENLETAPRVEAKAEESHDSESAQEIHWDYGDEVGPRQWGSLSPDYALCDQGRNQSPVDLHEPFVVEADLEVRRDFQPVEVMVSLQPSTVNLLDNGHTIQVSFDEGNEVHVGDKTFHLIQYHFHAPSEHTVDGQHYPMEMHFVHASDDGELVVAGMFIEEGEHNEAFDPVWNILPKEVGESRVLEGHDVDMDALAPKGASFLRYSGSLTTPPCTEGVSWIVRKDPIALSAEQIATFTSIFDGNNRPVQPRNDRVIAQGSPTYIE